MPPHRAAFFYNHFRFCQAFPAEGIAYFDEDTAIPAAACCPSSFLKAGEVCNRAQRSLPHRLIQDARQGDNQDTAGIPLVRDPLHMGDSGDTDTTAGNGRKPWVFTNFKLTRSIPIFGEKGSF
jgi:hypothetical protein